MFLLNFLWIFQCFFDFSNVFIDFSIDFDDFFPCFY